MATFRTSSSLAGVYVPESQIGNPGGSRVALLMRDGSATADSITLADAWANDLAYYALMPAGVSDWSAFAANARAGFTAPGPNTARRLGWFDESGNTKRQWIEVGGAGANRVVSAPANLAFRTTVLQVYAPANAQPKIGLTQDGNGFEIECIDTGSGIYSISLQVSPPEAQRVWVSPTGNLTIPMQGDERGTCQMALSLNTKNFAAFEPGLTFYEIPAGGASGSVQPFRYPLIGVDASQATIGLDAVLDFNAPVDASRTYFGFSDAQVASYFATASGRRVALTPLQASLTDHGGSALPARLAFVNRAQNSEQNQNAYYLAPQGSFRLGIADETARSTNGGSQSIVCGLSGTEYLTVTTGNTGDTITFVPGQPSLRKQAGLAAAADGGASSYFGAGSNNTLTTSYAWVQPAGDSAAKYFGQPQDAPLYAPGGGATGPVFLLDFQQLPTWPAAGGAQPTPLAPLVPYRGIGEFYGAPSAEQQQSYQALEAQAINPQRRVAFQGANNGASSALTALTATGAPNAMTPQGLLAQIESGAYASVILAKTQAGTSPFTTQFTELGQGLLPQSLLQNEVFAVISQTSSRGKPQFAFAGDDQRVAIANWTFQLSPDVQPNPQSPKIIIFKFFRQSLIDLVDNIDLWSNSAVFNANAVSTQSYLRAYLQQVCGEVFGANNCSDGQATAPPDTSSLYWPFYQIASDPNWMGVLVLNASIDLDQIPAEIQSILGGMRDAQGNSNVSAFLAHHVGITLNDIDPGQPDLVISKSSLFGLIDYNSTTPAPANAPNCNGAAGPCATASDYVFRVKFLRVLFSNSELADFQCEVDLTVNTFFRVGVTLDGGAGNVIPIDGKYQQNDGAGLYSFVNKESHTFQFNDEAANIVLAGITLNKIQLSPSDQTPAKGTNTGGTQEVLRSRFAMWGDLQFKTLPALDVFGFDSLVFANLGVNMQFALVQEPGQLACATDPCLAFDPSYLRFDPASSKKRETGASLQWLLPLKLKSFIYAGNGQSPASLGYAAVEIPTGVAPPSTEFTFALLFELDGGTLGKLVGSLEAFKFQILVGWNDSGIILGIQLPEANGKLEINIEGVLKLTIQRFVLQFVTPETASDGDDEQILVLALLGTTVTILGTKIPKNGTISFALFAPLPDGPQKDDHERLGWFASYKESSESALAGRQLVLPCVATPVAQTLPMAADDDGEGSSVFKLSYAGLGQRVGPGEDDWKKFTSYGDFLSFMKDDFDKKFEDKDYLALYQPEGGWLALADFTVLDFLSLGIIFYDTAPFYSLSITLANPEALKGFHFDISYKKVSDQVGVYLINLTLPDSIRTFNVGAVGVRLPEISLDIYTNGDFKLDVGFPRGDDWSRSAQIQAQVGPVPVIGFGGFYLAKLSSATDQQFTGAYPLILAFGFALRIGVGKEFNYAILKAGLSVTFFGIIEGAGAYREGTGGKFPIPDAIILSGQVGVIGELYGVVDFAIIKASVTVRISASIGLVLNTENSTNLLLYVQASVLLAIEVTINLWIVKIHITLKFQAQIRFSWEVTGSSSSATLLAAPSGLRMLEHFPLVYAPAALAGSAPPLTLLYAPELTAVFGANGGQVYAVNSLVVQYSSDPSKITSPADFRPFEHLAYQFAAWAAVSELQLSGPGATVTQQQMDCLSRFLAGEQLDPACEGAPAGVWAGLTWGQIDAQLQNFVLTLSPLDTTSTSGAAEINAAYFPMPPFASLTSKGRVDGQGKVDEISIDYSKNNPVSGVYVQSLADYFSQLYVNISGQSGNQALAEGDPFPLCRWVFVDYFNTLVRGAVSQVWNNMVDNGTANGVLTDLLLDTAKAGGFSTLGAQLSSTFRHGLRLTTETGMTQYDGSAATGLQPLYGLLWQQFPVGAMSASAEGNDCGAGNSACYTLTLAADGAPPWFAGSASATLTDTMVKPYQGLTVAPPAAPVQLNFLNKGPQQFAFKNNVSWTPQGAAEAASLRPFPAKLVELLTSETSVAVEVCTTDPSQPYAPKPAPVTSGFVWATQITAPIQQVPDEKNPGAFLKNVYQIGGTNLTNRALLRNLLAGMSAGSNAPVTAIDVLYQAPGGAGLTSDGVDPTQVFVLRTNTTTQSAPPPSQAPAPLAFAAPPAPSVGSNLSEVYGFLQILELASLTNAPGFLLGYPVAFPSGFFAPGRQSTITVLIQYAMGPIANYANTIALASPDANLLYFAQTTDAALESYDVAVAAGAVGFGVTLEAPDAAASEASAGLDALYSLLSYQVAATADFVASNESAPVGPQAMPADGPNGSEPPDPNSSASLLRAFVPLYKRANANEKLPAGSELNRYAGIGGAYSVNLFRLDAFGNQVPQPTNQTGTQLYFDNLVNFTRWQGIALGYSFLSGGNSTPNTVYIALTPGADSIPTPGTDAGAQTLALYQTIYDQLTGPGVSLTLQSTLDPGSAFNQADYSVTGKVTNLPASDLANVTTLVEQMIAYLGGGPAIGSIQPVSIAYTFPAAASDQRPDAFEITLELGIARDKSLIAPEVLGTGGNPDYLLAQWVSMAVPQQAAADFKLDDLASAFVAAFAGFVLSTALATGGDPAFWAVRRRLLHIDLTAPSVTNQSGYLSPKPLATELRSETVPMPVDYPFLKDQGLPANQTFTDVDLDTWGRGFFAAVDGFLSPGSAAAAFAAAPDGFRGAASGRQSIADRYSANEVEWLYTAGSTANLAEAREDFAQQMRAALASAYVIDTILQAPAQWAEPLAPTSWNRLSLFGQVQQTSADATTGGAYKLSTAKLAPADPASTAKLPSDLGPVLTFLFGTKTPAAAPNVSLALEYNPTHLEVFLDDGSTGEKPRPSLWLELLQPFTAGQRPQMGTVEIPIVLRAYPTPPTVIDQSATPSPSAGEACEGVWAYSFEYQALLAGQDELRTAITYNTNTRQAGSTAFAAAAPVYTLFQSLARFTAAYPLLQPVLSQLGSGAAPADAADVITAFEMLVSDVANNSDWAGTAPLNFAAPGASGSLANVTDSYIVSSPVDVGSAKRQVEVCPNQSSFSSPLQLGLTALAADGSAFSGQSTSAGDCLRVEYEDSSPAGANGTWVRQRISVGNLNVLRAENALAAASVARNVHLLGMSGPATGKQFQYQTGQAAFTQPVTPYIDSDTPIDVAALQAPSTGLDGRLTALFDCVFAQHDLARLRERLALANFAAEAPLVRRIRVECGFAYDVLGAAGTGAVPLAPRYPVQLARSFDVSIASPSSTLFMAAGTANPVELPAFITEFAKAIGGWAAGQGLPFGDPGLATDPYFVFDVTLYSALSGENLPVLRLRNFQLKLQQITGA